MRAAALRAEGRVVYYGNRVSRLRRTCGLETMASKLTRFQVIGLHGSRTMDVRLEDNKLVLVGENGTGKSTFVNLIYYFLTKQWDRLREYRFSRIQAHFGDQELVFTPEHVEQHLATRQHLLHFLPISRQVGARVTRGLIDQLMELSSDPSASDTALIERMAAELRAPPRVVRQMLSDYLKETKGKPTHLHSLERLISSLVEGQFLYLPT